MVSLRAHEVAFQVIMVIILGNSDGCGGNFPLCKFQDIAFKIYLNLYYLNGYHC